MGDVLDIPYQHPVVRDLAWVMRSPGLLRMGPAGQVIVADDWCRQIYIDAAQQLGALDNDPSPLLQALSQNKSYRLGVYFESLLRYWLEEILQVRQLRHNVPVFEQELKKGKRTLGEFDFLFRLAEKEPLQHWEATVKFYLLRSNEKGEGYWLGPGGRDRLDAKLERMFQHQLKLSTLPQAQAVLGNHANPPVESAAFIKGYLFYPLGENGKVKPLKENAPNLAPHVLANEHLQGWWLRWQSTSLPHGDDTHWLVLPKLRWLSPVRQVDETGMLDFKAMSAWLERHFRQHDTPLLLAELRLQTGVGGKVWEEISRGFVLPPA